MGSHEDSQNVSAFQVLDFKDSDLVTLSSPQPRRLFTALDRASSMSSLIVVLAVVPPLLSMHQRAVTNLDAEWGLRAMAVLASDSSPVELAPGVEKESQMYLHQPPLSSWLTAISMRLLGTNEPLSHIFVSYLAIAGSIIMLSRVVDQLIGERCAMISAAIASTQVSILQWTQSLSPVAISIFLGLLATNQLLLHARFGNSIVSYRLLVSGLALGLCLLASGLWMFCVAVTALILSAAASRREPGGWDLRRHHPGILLSWIIFLVTALVVGGWWFLLQVYVSGIDSLRGLWRDPVIVERGREEAADWLAMFGGALTGLLVVGVFQIACVILANRERKTRVANCPYSVLSWFLTALIMCLISLRTAAPASLTTCLAISWLAISSAGLIAWTINEMAEARCGNLAAVAMGFLGAAAVWVSGTGIPGEASSSALWIPGLLVLGCVSLAAVVWATNRPRRPGEIRHILIGTLLVTLWTVQLLSSLASLTNSRIRYREALESMAHAPDVTEAVCVSSSTLPAEIRFLLQALNDGKPVETLSDLRQLRDYIERENKPSPREQNSRFEDSISTRRRVMVASWLDNLNVLPLMRQLGWSVEIESPLYMIEGRPFKVWVLSWQSGVQIAVSSDSASDDRPQRVRFSVNSPQLDQPSEMVRRR